MTLETLVRTASLNYSGLLRLTRYKVRGLNNFYNKKRYSELSPEMQRMIDVLHNNLKLLYYGKTFYTEYEGLRKCQVKVHSPKFYENAPMKRPIRHHKLVEDNVNRECVKWLLDKTEEFIKGG